MKDIASQPLGSEVVDSFKFPFPLKLLLLYEKQFIKRNDSEIFQTY